MNTSQTFLFNEREREGVSRYLPDTVAFPEMELGADTRDAADTATGAVPLQVAMVAGLTHTCGWPGVLIIEPTEDDTVADPSDCSTRATEAKLGRWWHWDFPSAVSGSQAAHQSTAGLGRYYPWTAMFTYAGTCSMPPGWRAQSSLPAKWALRIVLRCQAWWQTPVKLDHHLHCSIQFQNSFFKSAFKDWLFFIYMCMCTCVSCLCRCLQKSREGSGSRWARLTGGLQAVRNLPWVLGTELRSSRRASSHLFRP